MSIIRISVCCLVRFEVCRCRDVVYDVTLECSTTIIINDDDSFVQHFYAIVLNDFMFALNDINESWLHVER